MDKKLNLVVEFWLKTSSFDRGGMEEKSRNLATHPHPTRVSVDSGRTTVPNRRKMKINTHVNDCLDAHVHLDFFARHGIAFV
eukprot:1710534-Amphidinium_carterae.1